MLHPHLIDLGPFEPLGDGIKDIIASESQQAKETDSTFVLSHERLSGHPSSGGFDSATIAHRLSELMPQARILIIIREQNSIIRSAYSQFITEGGSLSLSRFLNPPQRDVYKMPWFSLRHFEYAPLIERYQKLFGVSNVLVLPFEHFTRRPIDFLNRVGRFSKTQWDDITADNFEQQSVNAARRVLTQSFRRALNASICQTQFSNSGWVNLPKAIRLFEKTSAKLEWMIPKSLDRWQVKRQKTYIQNFTGDYYQNWNRQTSDLIGFDLNELGYR